MQEGIKKFVIPGSIIAGAILMAIGLNSLKNEPTKINSAKQISKVEAIEINPSMQVVELRGYGTITPKSKHRIITQVGGPILKQYNKLNVGTKLNKGDLIAEIDPIEYKYALEEEKGNLARAEFELLEERGRQAVAKREWDMLDDDIKYSTRNKKLALREAHVNEKIDNLKAAKSRLNKAILNLTRTKIIAPCDGIILSENIEVGQVINTGTEIAQFACTNTYQVVVSLPKDQIKWLSPENKVIPKSKATIGNRVVKLVRILPEVDSVSKMAKLLVEIDNPMSDEKPLLIGTFVETVIRAKNVDNVYTIPENAYREGGNIWTVANDKLSLVPVDLIVRRNKDILVRPKTENIDQNLKVITSSISSPYDGMQVKVHNVKKKNRRA